MIAYIFHSNAFSIQFINDFSFISFFGDLEAAPEAVKRKAVDEVEAVVEAADETAPTAEKKSKVEENGAAEEVVA